jgi:hypothetical protein
VTQTARQPVRIRISPPEEARQCLELVWDLSTRAGAALSECRALDDRAVAVAVRLERDSGAGHATAWLEAVTSGGGRRPLAEPRTQPVRWTREGGLEHVDMEGVVQCTIRHEAGARVLYARSALLASLAIVPGAYSLRAGPGHD